MLKPRFAAWTFSISLMVPGAGVVCGQDYPNKPIRIVAASAGGGVDFIARIISQGVSGFLHQPVIVENRPSGIIAAEMVSKAPADGYTLTAQGAAFWINPLLRKLPYEVGDFTAISLLGREVFIVTVHPSLPAHSVKELIALAKARPGELNYASTGIGSPQHIGTELFKSMAGANIVHVPYKGSAPAITALLSGEAQLMIMDAGLVAPHVKSGKLRVLAVTSAQPSALVPELSTVSASGLPGYEAVSMTGILAPAKTSEAIIKRLNQEIVRVLNLPEVKEKFFNAQIETVGSSPEEFAAVIKSETVRLGKVVKDAGIKAE